MGDARLMASGLKARASVFRVAFHMGSLVWRMLNMVSWNVFVASCAHTSMQQFQGQESCCTMFRHARVQSP